jgi:hypothetical protein
MCSRTSGTKMRTVKAVDTAIGGLFSGTLNKCCGGEEDEAQQHGVAGENSKLP